MKRAIVEEARASGKEGTEMKALTSRESYKIRRILTLIIDQWAMALDSHGRWVL